MTTALEHTITEVATRCLRGIAVNIDTPFELLGLDSLAAIELAAALETELGCELPPDVLSECRDVRALARRLVRDGITRASDDPFEQMFADAVLPDDLRVASRQRSSTDLREAKSILLTGATGFLGNALLHELLTHSATTVYCLVRDPLTSGIAASDRVRVVAGDLTHPRLGFSRAHFDAIAHEVDAVLHCGAAVNWVFSYAALRAANVLGTLELLRLACQGGAAFHFVSSLSVCYAADGPRAVDERFDALSQLRGLHLGYAQTKAIAETLVRQAGERGLPVRIYRPALVSGHGVTGAYNRDDLIATLVRGCVRMHTAPDLDWKLDALPVDTVAKSIVALSGRGEQVFHIAHPRPRHWRECVLWMRMCGYDVRLVSYPAWLRQLERETANDSSHPLRPLRSFFTARPTGGHGLTLPELYEERRRTTANSARSDEWLATLEVERPALDVSLLETYFEAFVASGDLAPVGRPFRPVIKPSRVQLPRIIQDALREAGHDVRRIEIISAGSDHSIVSELTAWRSSTPSGLFRARTTSANGKQREVMVKLKARDRDVIAGGEALADVVSPEVGRAYRHWSHQVGFSASHVREIALLQQDDPRFRRHAPEVLATVTDDASGTWMVIEEFIDDARLLDSAGHPHQWTDRDIASGLDGLAKLQSVWLGREEELRDRPWIGHVHSSDSMSAMTDLWVALANHAASLLSSWTDPDLVPLHRRLAHNISTWWPLGEGIPSTLIHNDFNPRNVCLRGADSRLCAYDWELATVGAPQRDLAEFLCFVLTPDSAGAEVDRWIERHRVALSHEAGAALDPVAWRRGFEGALCDLLVNRLAIYAMVHRVRPQPYLPRVVRTWREIYRHVVPQEAA